MTNAGSTAQRTTLHRELLRRGRVRVGLEWRDARDRLIASDPGLSQLRLGIRVLVAITTILLLEWLLSKALGVPAALPMLIGAVIAMVTSSGIRENTRIKTLTAAAPALPAAVIGVVLSALTVSNRPLSLIGFVVLSFLAVWVRRFGGGWITYGLVCWQSYFFVQFLHPPLSSLPEILAAVTLAAVWVAIVLSTLLYEDPATRLRRTVTALRARVRAAVSACLDVLEDPGADGPVRRLRSHLVRVSEVALLFDGQLSEARAIPAGARPSALRQWVVEVEIGVDELVRVVRRLIEPGTAVGPADLAQARSVLQTLGWGDRAAAQRTSREIAADPALTPAVRRLGEVAGYLVVTVDRWVSGELLHPNTNQRDRPGPDSTDSTAGADWVDSTDGDDGDDNTDGTDGDDGHNRAAAHSATLPDQHTDDDFEPVITLRAGKLPGTAAAAAEAVGDEAARWFSPAGLLLTTRQAIQAAIAAGLAIAVGHLVSPQRYYWAVIAAFIAFTGTATASETVRRSIGRVVGTTAGLVAAVLLANVTSGHTALIFTVLLVSLGLAWYLIAISYGAMIFMITVALGQLYALLHTFSDQVLVLRLQETVVGAVIGGLVGALVLPASALRTLRVARRQLLETLAELLDGCVASIRTGAPTQPTLAKAVALDADARLVVQATQSLIRGRFYGSDRAGLRRRVAVLGSAAAGGRRIAMSLARGFPAEAADANALVEVATEARRLAAVPRLEDPPITDGDNVAERVAALLDAAPPRVSTGAGGPPTNTERVPRTIRRLADTLTLLTPRGRAGR